MNNSVERIKYLTKYILNYESKIKAFNKLGLFDEAKMFELFAIEVCKLYFLCDFSNLNFVRNNYPCVDLISDSKDLYVQVSTSENVPTKIKNTLLNIKNSDNQEIKKIKKIYFLVLNNDSIGKVKDYTGKNKIGKISFEKNKNLITTLDILKKAENDLNFQQKLFDICKKNESTPDYEKFNEAINDSNLLIKDITDTIGGDYKINIDNLITEIEDDKSNFILVTGQAGTGKSVLCKHIVQKKTNFLYAKAERILELNDVDQIWNFSISHVFNSLASDFDIFIDSLEFVADNKTKLDLLNCLFSRLANYKNIRVICSCRESDRSSFIKLENNYNFSVHTVKPILVSEIKNISKKFPIVKDMMNDDRYRDLLSIPFYLNCLTKIRDITNIKNEDDLRNLIWEKMICLGDRKNESIITDLVLDRAINFLLGSDINKYDFSQISKLVSGNSLIEHNGTVRLKYDIFEDICFERYIDSLFDNCKGDYSIFFSNLSKLGRCIYRRLQIWIENKLFTKNNRSKFLYTLLNSESISNAWKKQIEIGIVKSRHSYDFLIENSDILLKKNYINELVKLVNLYGFEIDKVNTNDSSIKLKPIGIGRSALIKIIFEKEIYKTEVISDASISKIICDMSNDDNLTPDIASMSCKIIQYFVEKCISDSTIDYYDKYSLCKTNIKTLLNMSNYCSDWFKGYIKALIEHLSSHDTSRIRYASDSISDLICFDNGNLAISNYDDVIELFSHYFTDNLDDHNFMHYSNRDLHDDWKYGLNSNAESYLQDYRDFPANCSTCFWLLLKKNYWKTLSWLIFYLNNIATQYNKNEKLYHFDLFFADNETHKKFIGNERMWIASFQEYQVPTIISDLIFTFEKFTEDGLSLLPADEKKVFLERIKKVIIDNTNNIFLLSSILLFGLKNVQDVPGYAVDLASCLDLVLIDCSRFSLTINNPAKEVLEKEIIQKVGLPSLGEQRYKENNIQLDLRTYMLESQLTTKSVSNKCEKILEYLYSMTKNDEENAIYYLQIEAMDLKKTSFHKIDDSRYLVNANPTGEALTYSKKSDAYTEPIIDMYNVIKKVNNKLENSNLTVDEAKEAVLNLIEYVNHPFFPAISNNVFTLLCYCLKNENLSLGTRNELCNIWLRLLSQKQDNASIIIDCKFYSILFEQLKYKISLDIKNNIKIIILDSFISNNVEDISNTQLKKISIEYLKNNNHISRLIFNTILSLAEDEMNHQKYNFAYYKKKENTKEIFKPNLVPHLAGVDFTIKRDGAKPYCSNREKIIEKHLFNECDLIVEDFNIDNYDFALLCSAIECGIDFDSIAVILRQLLLKIIDIYHITKDRFRSHDIFDVYKQHDLKSLFGKFLLNENTSNEMINILFNDIDFSLFSSETFDFYVEVFDELTPYYYDDYESHKIRNLIENDLNEVEKKISGISSEIAKRELSKILIMAPSRFRSLNWLNCKTEYSYNNKMFLKEKYSKYGYLNFDEMIKSLYRLNYKKLFPELMLSISDNLKKIDTSNYYLKNTNEIEKLLKIYSCYNFLNYEEQIKQDNDLINAFENVLEYQVKHGSEVCAVLLDEFRIH